MRIGILGCYGHGNIGDEAILASLIKYLKTHAPSIDIIVFSDDPYDTFNIHKINAISSNIKKNFYQIFNTLKNIDMLIIGGGGLIHDYRSNVIPYYLFWCLIAKLLRKPVYLCSVGVGPLNTWTGKKLAYLLAYFSNRISVRDEESFSLLLRTGIRKDILVSSDLAILLPLYSDVITEKNIVIPEPSIGISLREWFQFEDRISFCQNTSAMVDQLINRLGLYIGFIIMCKNQDLSLALKIKNLCRNKEKVWIIDKYSNPTEMLTVLKNMELIIGMRLHSLIMGASVGVPILGLEYDIKVRNFLQSLELEEYCCRIEDLYSGRLIEKIIDLWDKRNLIKNHIKINISNLQKRTLYSNDEIFLGKIS